MKNAAANTAATKPAPGSRAASWQGMNWIRQEKRLAIYLRDGMACAYCGARAEQPGVSLSLDHLLPHSQGGSNKESNLVTCCSKCNSRRQDTDLQSWLLAVCGERSESVAAWIVSHTALDLRPFVAEAKAIRARRMAR